MGYQVHCRLLLVLALLLSVYGYGEPYANFPYPALEHPSYYERAMHLYINLVRVDPAAYKTTYMINAGFPFSVANILNTTVYPPTTPVTLHPNLTASAFNHSTDMASGCINSYNGCGGLDFQTRIKSFYNCSIDALPNYENFLPAQINGGFWKKHYSPQDPLNANNYMLCSSDDDITKKCPPDNKFTSDTVWRTNMMASNMHDVGVGYAFNGSLNPYFYWTQDYGSGSTCYPSKPTNVYAGYHRIDPTKNAGTKFIAVYYNTTVNATNFIVNVNGAWLFMTREAGALPGSSIYSLQQSVANSGNACRSYFFAIGDTRYPSTGCLVTYGENCTTTFNPTCSSRMLMLNTTFQTGWYSYQVSNTNILFNGSYCALFHLPVNFVTSYIRAPPLLGNIWTNLSLTVNCLSDDPSSRNASSTIKIWFTTFVSKTYTCLSQWQTWVIPMTELGDGFGHIPTPIGGLNGTGNRSLNFQNIGVFPFSFYMANFTLI